VSDTNTELLDALLQINRHLARLVTLAEQRHAALPVRGETSVQATLRELNARQHVVLQAVINGMNNEQIGEILRTTISNVKMNVRSVCRKFDVSSRIQLSAKVAKTFNEMHPDTYEVISGGIPKDWFNLSEKQRKKYSEHYEYD